MPPISSLPPKSNKSPLIPLILLRPSTPPPRILLNSTRPHRTIPPPSHQALSLLPLRPGLRKAIPEILLALIDRHIPVSRCWVRACAFDETVEAIRCALRTGLRTARYDAGCEACLGC